MTHRGGTAVERRRPPWSLPEALAWQARGDRAGATALVDGERRVRYADLLELAFGWAGRLTRLGVPRGGRVAIFLPRSVEAAAALFGTWLAGGVAVLLNEQLRSRQVEYIVRHAEASALVTDRRRLAAIPDARLDGVPVVEADALTPSAPLAEPAVPIGADLALIIYTSGSTGLPKGVMVSHDNLLSGATIVGDYLELRRDDVLVSLLPWSFDYGLNQLLSAVAVGASLVVQRSMFPPDICRTLARERVTGLAAVPMLWLQLTGRQSPFLTMSLPALRYATNTGGRLPERVVRAIRAAHPEVKLYLMYGLTEAFRSTYLAPDEVDRRPTSIGKAIPNVEILVVDANGRPCAAGEVGELVHRGATVSRGYWRDPETTARMFRPHPVPGAANGSTELVVFSGDLVRSDEQGYLYYVGRRDQLIKSRGIRVSPEEIERWAGAAEGVAGVVAFAVPGEADDDDIVIAVTARDAGGVDEAALAEFCRREMPEYMSPRAIWPVDEFPLTGTGKPDRNALRERYVEWTTGSRRAAGAAGAA